MARAAESLQAWAYFSDQPKPAARVLTIAGEIECGLPIPIYMGSLVSDRASIPVVDAMKTTLDIKDELLTRAKKLAERTGRPLRAVVEEGLRLVLSQQREKRAFRLEDCSVGDPNRPDPLESWSWQDLRDEIYGEPGRQ